VLAVAAERISTWNLPFRHAKKCMLTKNSPAKSSKESDENDESGNVIESDEHTGELRDPGV
jgi:hypothetical protein